MRDADRQKAENIISDKRKIKAVVHDEGMCNMWEVGKDGVTKIEAYGEPGEYCYVPFLAIYRGDVVEQRANALIFRIIYDIDQPSS